MMMKEHIVDTYGEIVYTVGKTVAPADRSGRNTVSSIYPGLVDGIQPSCDYPDSITTGIEVTDCVLLVNFYAGTDWATLMTGLDAAADRRERRPPSTGTSTRRAARRWNKLVRLQTTSRATTSRPSCSTRSAP